MHQRSDAELGALCQACGLCCDGSLFARVTLDPKEVRGARRNGLRVLQRGTTFEQPCSALRALEDRCACSVFRDRPRACRTFSCRLYERHRNEGGPLETRLAAVRRVRALLQLLETTTEDEARRVAIEELSRRMDDDFARAGARDHPFIQRTIALAR